MGTNKIFMDMAQRACEFAEMCRLMQKMPDMPLTAGVKDALDEYARRLGLPKVDPEAWREENRKKQAAGVKFDFRYNRRTNSWVRGKWTFKEGKKEDYREVPQELHAAERALWKAQREAGTNEVWQQTNKFGSICDVPVSYEPTWNPDCTYRVKPMKLTARIARKIGNSGAYAKVQDWQFTGTREEYRAECEKYGYVVVSEIKEVKPKTVTCYVVAIKASNTGGKEDVKNFLDKHCITIIGDIEEREVEA